MKNLLKKFWQTIKRMLLLGKVSKDKDILHEISCVYVFVRDKIDLIMNDPEFIYSNLLIKELELLTNMYRLKCLELMTKVNKDSSNYISCNYYLKYFTEANEIIYNMTDKLRVSRYNINDRRCRDYVLSKCGINAKCNKYINGGI